MLSSIRLLLLLLVAPAVSAVPALQLDIGSLTTRYDTDGQSIVTNNQIFTLRALGQVAKIDLGDTFHISLALQPPQSSAALPDFGSIVVNGGTPITQTSGDMIYGAPPLDDALFGLGGSGDPGDLSPHGIFDTWFAEIDFQFDGTTIGEYNAQDDPGLDPLPSGSLLYIQEFQIDLRSLTAGGLHFDLYSAETKLWKGATDVDIDKFAPFSHDAEYQPPTFPEPAVVPEPTSIALVLGALGLVSVRRRAR
jgi:hypothetical protein